MRRWQLSGGISATLPDGSRAQLSGQHQRLLTILLLARRRSISAAMIEDRLWSRRSAASAAAVRVAVNRLRHQLGEGSPIETGDGGYRLDAADEDVDLWHFEQLVKASQVEPDLARALLTIDAAIDLWRGAPFGSLRDEPWVVPMAAHLEELRRCAEEHWVDLSLRRGITDVDIMRIQIAAEREPLRERRWMQLMLALYRRHRQTDALRAATRARDTLLDTAGLEACRELTDLELRILQHDDELMSQLPWIPNLEAQLHLGDTSADAGMPQVAALDERPSSVGLSPMTIAAPFDPIVARTTELATIAMEMRTSRLVSLVGLGGVGKTRLAREIAIGAGDSFGEWVVFVDLAHIADPDLFPYAVASAIGLRNLEAEAAQNQLDRVIVALRPIRALLILDNVEHVLAVVQQFVRHVGVQCPHIRLLTTSRMPLGLPGERCIRIEPLGGESALRALQSMVDEPTQLVRHPEATARVIAAVGGLPLGLQIVAHLIDASSIVDVDLEVSQWSKTSMLIGTEGNGTAALHEVLRWGYDRLPDDAKVLFRRLALLPAPVTLATAGNLIDLPADRSVLELLAQLNAASLIDVDRTLQVSRYTTPFLQQAFGRALVREAGETAAIKDRIVRHYVSWVEREHSRFLGAEQFVALRSLLAELDNLRDLLHRLPLEGRYDDALRIVTALGPVWGAAGLCGEGQETSMRVLRMAPGEGIHHARAACAVAFASGTFAGLAAGLELYERAYATALAEGDIAVAARAMFLCAVARVWLRLPGGEDGFATAWALASSINDERQLADLIKMQGLAAGLGGDLTAATLECRSSADRMLALGDRVGAATALLNLGMLLQRCGDPEGAERALDDCMALVGEEGLAVIDIHVEYTRAMLAGARGADVRASLTSVRNKFRTMGDIGCQNGANRELAAIHRRNGELPEALMCLRDSLRAVATRDDQELAMALAAIAEIYLDLGRCDDARVLMRAVQPRTAGSGIGLNEQQLATIAHLHRRAVGSLADSAPAPDLATALACALV